MTAPLVQSYYTPEQYLELERKAQYKSEYINGHIFAMSGASRLHNLIAGNLYREISSQLRGRPRESYISDMRVRVEATDLITYPDVVVICGEIRLADDYKDTLLNPTVLIEVLSPSTEAYDRGEKFAHYRRLASLQEYVLIAQDKVCLEHFKRQGDQWVLTEISDIEGVLHLLSIECQDQAQRHLREDRVPIRKDILSWLKQPHTPQLSPIASCAGVLYSSVGR